MKNEKLCEYLSDVGVLLLDNIDLFFQIYSINNLNQSTKEQEKLKNSLFLYLQKTSKNENLLKSMSSHIIETYYNTQAINKYKALKNLITIFKLRLFSHYNHFITRVSLYITKKSKRIIKFESLKEKENLKELKRNNSDDFIKRKEKNLKEKNLKKVIGEKDEFTKLKQKKRKKNRTKKTNRYNNNFYRNINDGGVIQHGFFVDSKENLNKYNNIDRYDINYNDMENFEENSNDLNFNNYNNKYDREIDFPNNYNYNVPILSNNLKSKKLPINYYNSIYNNKEFENNENYYLNNNQEIIDDINIPLNYINANTIRPTDPNLKTYDFFENQEKFEKKVKNKLLNLQNEKLINLEKECTFTPKINSPISQRKPKNYDMIDNKFEKLYNDSLMNKIKKEQKIKKHLEEYKFTPDLKKTENFIVLSTFQERLEKSINMKAKMKNENNLKNKQNKNGKKEEKKKASVIDWEKIAKENNEKFKNENHYGNYIQKKKKNLENIRSQIDTNNNVNNDNIFIKEIKEIKLSDNKDYIIDKEEPKEKDNNIIIDNEKNTKDDEGKEIIKEEYKSSSIKNLLNNNDLLKNDY